MHLAKGLEFRAVAVMACDDEVIPLQERIETVGDDSALQEVYPNFADSTPVRRIFLTQAVDLQGREYIRYR